MPDTTFLLEPTITRTAYGSWLAASPHSSSLRIGVIGITEADARVRFEASLERCREIARLNKEGFGNEQSAKQA